MPWSEFLWGIGWMIVAFIAMVAVWVSLLTVLVRKLGLKPKQAHAIAGPIAFVIAVVILKLAGVPGVITFN